MAESKKSKKPRKLAKKAPKKSRTLQRGEFGVKPEAEVEAWRMTLEDSNAGIKEKKRALIELAHLGMKEANEVIEEFLMGTDVDELRQWAEMALDEGEYLASVPTSPEEEARMIKESVYQDYMNRYCELAAEIEDVEVEIAERKYEYEVVKRLKKKAKTGQAKEDWDIQEAVQHDLLVLEENRKEQLEEELRIVEAIMDEIESELGKKP